ncbi:MULTISPECIES: DUF5133 domain-containing protein [Streptomyces]|uniref:DUF5133 domain-containing protein n=1 Tax=Streptomyces TaxID=1883 RepID=UPI001E3AF794|nr:MULTISPECIES: DUF5133 domain-containing protein [Streptomyces]UFQ19803.1 DUF5133 domain-containing protein [Streptomyces huasconensis]WCL89426.1 DUF5133 domain-containing protein [Streptomyces sp. JCM 35825]
MLRPHPSFVHDLLETHATLRARLSQEDSAEVRRRLDDVTYTLCVSTGTRTLDAALASARAQLAGVASQADSSLAA